MPSPRPRRFRRRRAGAAIVAAGVLVLVLSGCVGEPSPTPTPTASNSSGPIFASDEEALAAAESAYGRYLQVADQIGSEGGASPERIRDVVAPEYAEELIDSFRHLAERGLHTTGATRFDGARLADYSLSVPVDVSIYVCLDVSAVRVLNSDGVDVTPSDRTLRAPLQSHFVSSTTSPEMLLPSGSEQWVGEDFC